MIEISWTCPACKKRTARKTHCWPQLLEKWMVVCDECDLEFPAVMSLHNGLVSEDYSHAMESDS